MRTFSCVLLIKSEPPGRFVLIASIKCTKDYCHAIVANAFCIYFFCFPMFVVRRTQTIFNTQQIFECVFRDIIDYQDPINNTRVSSGVR